MYEEPSCGCTGIRRCGICCPGLFKETAPRRPEWGDFATPLRHYVDDVSTATKWLCRECGRLVVQTEEQYRNAGNGPQRCSEHAAVVGDAPGGLWVDPGFVSEEEEARLVAFYDATDVNNSEATNDVELKEGDTRGEATRWVASQSGRRKCDFGPQANFKKKKCKIGDAFGARGFPQELKPLLRACSAAATAAPALNNYSSTPRPYVPVQASALDYQVATASNLDPHVDDEWVWGDRILGVCLLSTTVMTFVKRSSDDPVRDTFRLVLPQRCYFGISGDSRHAWMHAIAAADIVQRRISITIRELEETFVAEFPDLSKAVVDCASLADG